MTAVVFEFRPINDATPPPPRRNDAAVDGVAECPRGGPAAAMPDAPAAPGGRPDGEGRR